MSAAVQDLNVVDRCAAQLREAYEERTPIPPLRNIVPQGDIATAYQIQERNTEAWLAAGRRLVGRKIGLTATSVQAQLGVDQPDYGMLFADRAVLDGERVATRELLQPKVEAEVAFVLERDLTQERLLVHEVIDAIAYALPALEIVDSRIARWDIQIVDTIADNASSGMFVLGTTPTVLDAFDPRLCGMVLECNGLPVSFGAGAACLGNPLHALLWLGQKMVQVGRPLRAGDIVLSGALGPMVPARPGDWFEARINGLGSARVGFAGGSPT